MEAEIINAVASPHILKLLTEAFIPLVTILILVGLYRLAHQFVPQLVKAIKETSEQTLVLGKMFERTFDKIERLEDVMDDNTKRLDAIEITLKKINEEVSIMRIKNKLAQGKYDE